MKTEADKLRNSIQYGLGVMDSGSGEFKELSNKIDELFELSYLDGQSNPKIKQLEWKDNFKETRWHCDLPIGFYIIDTVRKHEPYRVRFYLSEYDLPKYERYCKTIEEAMMHAQKDFEVRVKECLTTE